MKNFRNQFILPKDKIYFLGNSLGLQPKSTSRCISDVLDQWSEYGVEGFFMGSDPWLQYHDHLTAPLSVITGAKPNEIVVMNSLTINLHLLFASFYRPDKERFKIICESNAFPSDQYMLHSHIKHHGLNPDECIVEVAPRTLEYTIRYEDIAEAIHRHSSQLALVFWGGVNYYTGQVFDMKAITQLAHDAGAMAGFDLAHAVGNIPLALHEWNADFACWCSYKYLNSGPGGIAGAYVHERYHDDKTLPRLTGWWGYERTSRFEMKKQFVPANTAEGWQVSTPPITLMASLRASLEIFTLAGMEEIFSEGQRLSDHLIDQINSITNSNITILTPPEAKGCQVSLLLKNDGRRVFEQLMKNGIFADWREPDVIRVAPVPLYNTFEEVEAFARILKKLTA